MSEPTKSTIPAATVSQDAVVMEAIQIILDPINQILPHAWQADKDDPKRLSWYFDADDWEQIERARRILSAPVAKEPAPAVRSEEVEAAIATFTSHAQQGRWQAWMGTDGVEKLGTLILAARQAPESVNRQLLYLVKEHVKHNKVAMAHLKNCACLMCRMEAAITRAESAVASEDTRDKTIEELRLAIGELTERHQNMTATAKALRQELDATKADADKTIAELREKLDAIHCVFCGSVVQQDFYACKNHVLTCLNHPMRAVKAKLAVAEATIAKLPSLPLTAIHEVKEAVKKLATTEHTADGVSLHVLYKAAQLAVSMTEQLSAARAAQAPTYVPKPCNRCWKNPLLHMDGKSVSCSSDHCPLYATLFTRDEWDRLTGASK